MFRCSCGLFIPLRLPRCRAGSLLFVEFIEGFADDVVFGPVDGRAADDVLRAGDSAEVGVCLCGGRLAARVFFVVLRGGVVL